MIVFITNVHDGRAAVGCDVRASTMVVSNRRIALAVARPESGADGKDGRWGRNGATARRASTPDDRWRRGRAASSVAVGAAVLLFFVVVAIFVTGLPRQTFSIQNEECTKLGIGTVVRPKKFG